jgi:inorganic triphosphatase YgiF
VETETTLLVVGSRPSELFEELASRRSIAGRRVLSRRKRCLEDLYLDTAEAELAGREIALRLRRVGGKPGRTLITVKGPARVHPDGRMERRELERPWAAGVLEEVLDALEALGARLPRGKASAFRAEAPDSLAPLGLEIVQERGNERCALLLGGEAGEEAEATAELDLDSVTFRFPARWVRHFEIEIEARSAAGPAALGVLAGTLLEEDPDGLLLWPHSKTATGEALSRLEDEGTLAALLDRSDRPTREGYRELARLLEG